MENLDLTVTSFYDSDYLKNCLVSGKYDPSGIYVLAPYFLPYYVGMSSEKFGIFKEIRAHLNKFKNENQFKYVVFKECFYSSGYQLRNMMIPRSRIATHPPINFYNYAVKYALFWRENQGLKFMNSNDLINPTNPYLPLSNVKNPLKRKIKEIIKDAFFSENFKFFYIEIDHPELKKSKAFLEFLETIVKFLLKANTIGKSLELDNSIMTVMNSFEIRSINFQISDKNVKELFHPSPFIDSSLNANSHIVFTPLQKIISII